MSLALRTCADLCYRALAAPDGAQSVTDEALRLGPHMPHNCGWKRTDGKSVEFRFGLFS
jgi:hypothetical protein